jgi:hypothetical protein
VVPQISVSPESVMLGEVAQGQQATKKFIVSGKKPFKITSFECEDKDSFQFKTDSDSKPRHIVELTFNAKKSPGTVKEAVHVVTDLGQKLQAELTAYATIVPAAVPATATSAPPAAAPVTAATKPAPIAVPGDGTPAATGGTATTAAKPIGTTPASVARQE